MSAEPNPLCFLSALRAKLSLCCSEIRLRPHHPDICGKADPYAGCTAVWQWNYRGMAFNSGRGCGKSFDLQNHVNVCASLIAVIWYLCLQGVHYGIVFTAIYFALGFFLSEVNRMQCYILCSRASLTSVAGWKNDNNIYLSIY